jgi:hypothetical protein
MGDDVDIIPRIFERHRKEKKMSETGDYDPGCWTGHDFTAARKKYDAHVDRSYGDAVSDGVDANDLILDRIKTKSKSPLIILCDVTGSMGEWPATIFSKLPYLELEGKEYLGDDMEIAFGAIGDYTCDRYPLQMRDFAKGLDLKKRMEELVIEGGGGGQIRESYEMGALYCARNVDMPLASKPICIIIGDEGFYDTINKADAKKHARVDIEGRLKSSDVFDELKRRFAVYLVRKPYEPSHREELSHTDKTIHAQWEKVLGNDHIVMLPDAGRIADVIFGILAQETDRVDYFRGELKDRQKPDQVKTVLKSLKTVHKIDEGEDPSRKLLKPSFSVTKGSGGKKTKSLL